MFLVRHILIAAAFINLSIFLFGLFLGIFRDDFLIISFVLTSTGLLGMLVFALLWFFKPKMLRHSMYQLKELRKEKELDIGLTPDTTEAVMKNIRGIPFLMQAIQYSMETTYYRDQMNEMGEGMVRTSVIHTAPACTSVLDSDSEEEEAKQARDTPRHSAEEQWQPFGESWRNQQLRLSLERTHSNLHVFPYAEASPRESMNRETIEHDFSRIESIKRPHGWVLKTCVVNCNERNSKSDV